jgi:hypothetical protein
MMIAAKKEQNDALGTDEEHRLYKSYVVGDGFTCDEDRVYETMKGRNRTFVSTIVRYFSRKYKVDLDEEEIKEHLFPAAPEEPDLPWGGYRSMSDDEIDAYKEKTAVYKEAKEKYDQSLCALPLRYEQIVDEIFVQLGGFSFQERAMNEFMERIWNCCHNQYSGGKEKFEIKNDTLRLNGYGYWISVDENKWMSHPVPEYRLYDDMRTLLHALAYYECGRMDEGSRWFPELFKYDTKENQFDLAHMKKLKSIKFFKNGRVDIKFRNATYAQEFVEQYLRRKAT